MDKALSDYYENRFDMMATVGWKDLMDDIDKAIAATDRIGGITSEAGLHFKRGELSILTWMRNMQNMSNDAFEELSNG